MGYSVYIDDNFHWHDDSAGIAYRKFETFAEAEKCSKEIVDESIEQSYKAGMKWHKLLEQYEFGGADPYIVPNDGRFSAKAYARSKCVAICS